MKKCNSGMITQTGKMILNVETTIGINKKFSQFLAESHQTLANELSLKLDNYKY